MAGRAALSQTSAYKSTKQASCKHRIYLSYMTTLILLAKLPHHAEAGGVGIVAGWTCLTTPA